MKSPTYRDNAKPEEAPQKSHAWPTVFVICITAAALYLAMGHPDQVLVVSSSVGTTLWIHKVMPTRRR